MMIAWSNLSESVVKEFILLGFPEVQPLLKLLFLLFFFTYTLTVTGNLIIICIIKADNSLHRPMYFFLSNFAFMQILYTTVTAPKLLFGLIVKSNTISIYSCFAQCYFFFLCAGVENFLLALMAYDRYVAICHPLRYNDLMTSTSCRKLAFTAWSGIFIGSLLPLIFLARLNFCNGTVINHYFCDVSPLLKLSCSDTSLLKLYFFSLMWIIMFGCFAFIMVSYINIIIAVMNIPSTSGRQKVFSTCGSHLTVVILYYSALIFMYVRPRESYSFQQDKWISVFYSIVTPLLNPFIYCLRNKEVNQALKKIIKIN